MLEETLNSLATKKKGLSFFKGFEAYAPINKKRHKTRLVKILFSCSLVEFFAYYLFLLSSSFVFSFCFVNEEEVMVAVLQHFGCTYFCVFVFSPIVRPPKAEKF
jgi:hypothetical protein